jgi:hypothetical protein
MASVYPTLPALNRSISGSIEGEASQNDMTGASGTPDVSRAAITGITPHEQNGLTAPISVASNTATTGFAPSLVRMAVDAPERLRATDSGTEITKNGARCRNAFPTNRRIAIASFITIDNSIWVSFIVKLRYIE